MMKKTTQTSLLVFSTLLLLVSVTASAQGQPANRPARQSPTGSAQDRLRGNAVSFTGTWNTVTDKGKKIVITLRHERADPSVVTGDYLPSQGLTGSYKPLDGSINGFVKVSWRAEPVLQTAASIRGKVTDNVLRFTWVQDNAHGAGRFTLSSDGESFEGTFSKTSNPDDTSGGTWNGTRQHSFAGVWHAKLGEAFLELIFQQAGTQVTGQVKMNSADMGIIMGGNVVGNTLRFTIMRLSRPGSSEFVNVGNGELVMDKGGKSFKGTVLGTATSGTLVGR
jgi:hypothetical protein